MSDKYDPTQGNVIPVFFHYAIPSVVGMLAMSSAFMVDGIFVGNYVGADALAAVNLSMPVWSGLFAIVLMLSVGGAVMAGSYIGENDYVGARDIFSRSIACALVFAVIICLLGLLFLEPLILGLGATGVLIELVAVYLEIILIFSPLFLMGTALFYFVRVDGNPILASLSLIISAMINIVLDWVFLAEMGMGIEGAAYATGISQSLILIILFSHFLKKDRHLRLTSLSGSWQRVYQGMANGFSEFANEISIGLTMLLLNWVMITRVGIDGVAALTIVNYLFFIGVIVFYGIGESLQPLISRNLGARQARKISLFLLAAFTSTLLVAVVICSILVLIPELLIGIFLKPGETAALKIATEFISYFWPAFLFVGLNITLTEYFTACQKPLYSVAIALSRSLILPCILLVSLPLWLNDVGIYLAIPLAEGVTFLFALALVVQNQPEQIIKSHAGIK